MVTYPNLEDSVAKKKKDQAAKHELISDRLVDEIAELRRVNEDQQKEIEELECIIDDLTATMARQRRVRQIAQLCIWEDISPCELAEYMFGTDEDDDDEDEDEDDEDVNE
jgi:citrate lyase beta subunit